MKKISKKSIKHTIGLLKKLLDGYRLEHGYKIIKRKRKKKREKEYKLF